MMHRPCSIVWFRQDLRVEDNPALSAACERGAVLPLFIWCPNEEGSWTPGGASKWWLHHSLECLQADLMRLGLNLTIRQGPSLKVLQEVISETKATAVYWNRRYEPYSIERDTTVKSALQQQGIEAKSFNSTLLFEPWTIANKQGKPFQVFTPFWNACSKLPPPSKPFATPLQATSVAKIKTEALDSLKLLPRIHWDEGIKHTWQPGTKAAKQILSAFLQKSIYEYPEMRDRPDVEGVSKLSPYLHFGEISPRMIWDRIPKEKNTECYLRQLGWREFAHHLLYHFPKTPDQPLRQEFTAFPWKENPMALKAWQKGCTGYPFVDAGMRQLWHTGWMHNRVRMVVGSFLVKDLLLPWMEGAKWFWDTLVDADLANNTMGWQWVGGCGADAAPYFRVFNPITQGEKFDPEGIYIRQWIPELAKLPDKWIHRPWEAPALIMKESGITLGKDYPYPIVEHAKARELALAAFKQMRNL